MATTSTADLAEATRRGRRAPSSSAIPTRCGAATGSTSSSKRCSSRSRRAASTRCASTSAPSTDAGVAERLDVVAALDHLAARYPGCRAAHGRLLLRRRRQPQRRGRPDRAAGSRSHHPLSHMAVDPPRQPTLVLVAEHDQFCPPSAVEPIVATWPDATIEIIASADHFLAGHANVGRRHSGRLAQSETDGFLDLGLDVGSDERDDVERGEVVVDLADPAGARDHGRHVRVRGAPGERELRHRAAEAIGDRPQPLDACDRVGVDERFCQPLVPGERAAGVVGDPVAVLAGQQPGRERAPDRVAVAVVVDDPGVLVLDLGALEQVVLRLFGDRLVEVVTFGDLDRGRGCRRPAIRWCPSRAPCRTR